MSKYVALSHFSSGIACPTDKFLVGGKSLTCF